MLRSLLVQRILHLRRVSKMSPNVVKQCLVSLSTQSFYNNSYNAVLLKESESALHDINFDYSATHHTVMELLDCSPADAIHLIEADPDLLRLPANDLMEIKKLCRENNIPQDIVKKNLTWISRMKPVELNHRFLYYWKWSFRNEKERPEIFVLLNLTLSKLTSFTCRAISEKSKILERNRISYFSNKLESSVSECTNLVIKYPFLLTRSLKTVFEIVDSLLEAGVHPKDIYKDPWLILNSSAYVKERLEVFKERGIKNIKPWMVRCQDSTLARCIEIRQLALDVSREFDIDTKEQYLCERLNADPWEFIESKRKYPRVAQISLTKLKIMLDLLLNAGFEPKDIFKHPQVLTFSPETIERRLKDLGDRQVETWELSTLSLRNKKFEAFLKKMDKKLS